MARAIVTSQLPCCPTATNARVPPPSPSVTLQYPAVSFCKFELRSGRRSREALNRISTAAGPKIRHTVIRAAQTDEAQPGDVATEIPSSLEDAETCEIVQGSNVTLGEGDDEFQGYLIQALKNNNGVAVLFLTDVYGYEDGDSRDFAYRLACFGYNVLVPDLFRGKPWAKEKPQSEFDHWREQHSPDRVAGDIDVATQFLSEQIDGVGKLGVIGFCYGGGRLIETLARDSGNVFATGAFFYGAKFESSLGSQIKVPLLLIAGDSDEFCPTDVVHQLEKDVPGSKVKIYPGFGHAFAHHPKSAEEDDASEDAFTEARHWLHDRLLTHVQG